MEPDWTTVGVLGAARAGRPSPEAPMGTENLLAGISTAKGPAREALTEEGATRGAVGAVLRTQLNGGEEWRSTDDAGVRVESTDILGEDGDKGLYFTGDAARALRAAIEAARAEGAGKLSAVHLLRALLDGGENRAAELLGACGTSPQAVLTRLDGDAGERDDGLPPALHPTREILLGRAQYGRMTFWKRWITKAFSLNWAAMPVGWIRYETEEQARRLGHRTVGTEHVLLAVLATHEVVTRYPHFVEEPEPALSVRYSGGERLATAGVGYVAVHDALSEDGPGLSTDPRPFERYFKDVERGGPPAEGEDAPAEAQSSGPLVEALLAEETRARQLLRRLAPHADL